MADDKEATPAAATKEEKPTADEGNEGDDDNAPHEEEDTGAHFAPLVTLAEVSVTSGEEDEEELFKIKSKLYRFDRELGEWKERGVGDAKLLKNKKTGKIRLLMRRERTLKICANHFVNPLTELKEHAGSDKAWVWQTMDYADGEQKDELFTMKFGSVDSAQRFKAEFAKAQEHMKTVLADGGATVDKAADALKELSVKEEPTEGKEEKEEAS